MFRCVLEHIGDNHEVTRDLVKRDLVNVLRLQRGDGDGLDALHKRGSCRGVRLDECGKEPIQGRREPRVPLPFDKPWIPDRWRDVLAMAWITKEWCLWAQQMVPHGPN